MPAPRSIRSLRRTSWRWFPLLGLWRDTVARLRQGRGPRRRTRLDLELLEDYTLPSASISGNIWNDLNGDGARQPVELGLAARVAYLDLNHDGRLDTVTTSRAAASTVITTAPGALGSFGGEMASLQAQGLPGKLTNLAVTMDLANNGGTAVVVAVISPIGLSVPNLPNLFTIRPGEHFVGTFDGTSTNAVATAPRPLPPGTYAPEQSFDTPLSYINGTDPNGLWGLVFFGDTSGLDLKSWSLTFTTQETTTTTDAQGNYSFQGLAAGRYDVRVALTGADAQTAPTGNAARVVSVADGHDATGNDFGIQPAPDLTPVTFRVTTPAAAWGQDVTVAYTVTNQGDGAASGFDLAIRLSPDGRIGPSGPLLKTVHIAGLGAGASMSGTATVHLPDAPPAGFGDAGAAYLGVLVDPANAVAEADESNNGNQGAGIDLALVSGSTGAAANVPIARDGGVQQSPSLAVDPTNPLHLVSAYLDAPLGGAYTGLSVANSTDGGATWTRTAITLPAGFDQAAAAPTVVFDAAGGIHISFMSVTFLGSQPALPNPDSSQRAFGFTSNNGVFVVSSINGGASWGPAVAVASNLYSGTSVPFETYPSLAADTSRFLADGVTANRNFGSLYVAWSRFYPAGQYPGQSGSTSGSDVMIAVSRDGGLTWQTQTQTDPGTQLTRSAILDPRFKDNATGLPGRGFITFPTVTVGTGGDVYVSTYAAGNFVVYHSADGGRTFTAPNYDSQTGLVFPTLNGIIVPSPALQSNAYTGLPGTRTLPLRPIVADPTHPGRVYAVAVNSVTAQVGPQAGQVIDPGDVLFAVSDDYGQTWTSNFTILKQPPVANRLTPAQIATYAPALNDDNAGEPAGLVEDLSTQVLAGQALPSLAVDTAGNVVVVWYDTRVGPFAPNNPNTPITNALTVWGTVSRDGGRTFSPNFQISDTPFDLINTRFVAGNGSVPTYLGDQLGVVIANGSAYVAWTDARQGRTPLNGQLLRQDVYLGRFPLFPNPSAPADRFGGNNTLATATDLTARSFTVTTPLDLARLVLSPGRADKWFVMQTGATGPLTAIATGALPGDLHLEITDESGTVLTATATDVTDASGAVVGTRLTVPATAGSIYFVHAFGTNDNALSFRLSLSNLTADLGPQVQGSVTRAVAGQDVYRLVAGATGTMTLNLEGDGSQALVVLTPDGVTPLFDGTQNHQTQTTLQVTEGQTLLLLVIDLAGAGGTYTLGFTNRDQYAAGNPTVYLPTTGTPASVATADLNQDGRSDLITTSTDRQDAVNVFLGNGDGTFQAPREFDAGAGLRGSLTADNRQPTVLDVNHDGIPDAVVPNFRAADVSVLLGRGDGTFQPQRRADAVTSPDFTATGDFDGDGNPDLVVLQNFPQLGSVSELAVLFGHGDGTFGVPNLYRTAFTNGAGPVLVGDFTGDGKADLLIFSKNTPLGQLFRGNGGGTFTDTGTFATPENAFTVQAVDLNADRKLDLLFGGTNSGNVYTALGNGDGTFQPAQKYTVMVAGPGDNVGVRSIALIDYDPINSPIALTPPPAGTDYGTQALVLTAASRTGQGDAEVILLPGLVDRRGHFAGFSATPVTLATVQQAGNLAVGDFDGDHKTDVAVADAGGVTVVFGISASPPAVRANTTPAAARNLATVTHYITPTLSIVASHTDAYYTLTVPTESAANSGNQVVDISALFRYESGSGLRMEVLDAAGNVLGSGSRVRVVAAQGAKLMVHVFGLTDTVGNRGFGAYTLDIDVLPQVVSAQAQSVLPGGPATSIVLTLQGDRLDPATAEDPANYTVTWLGANGDTRVIPVAATGGAQPVVYNPGANLDVSSGRTFPTAVRQTVTLLFAEPLPVGSYSIVLNPRVQTAAFSPAEVKLLAGGPEFAGHPLVSVSGTTIRNGGEFLASNLVADGGTPGDLSQFGTGTPFLTQLQNDLGSMLDAMLRANGDDPSITPAVMAQILARMLPGLDPTGTASLLVIWLDPVSINLADSEGSRTTYDEGSGAVASGLRNTFVEVGGNVELVVVAAAQGSFRLNVGDAGAAARGGVAVITGASAQTSELTSAMRAGTTSFDFLVGAAGAAQSQAIPTPQTDAGPSATPTGAGSAGTAITSAATEGGIGGGTAGSGGTLTSTAVASTVIALLLNTSVGTGNLVVAGPGGVIGAAGSGAGAGLASNAAAGNGTVLAALADAPLVVLIREVLTLPFDTWVRDIEPAARDLAGSIGDAVRSAIRWLTPVGPVGADGAEARGDDALPMDGGKAEKVEKGAGQPAPDAPAAVPAAPAAAPAVPAPAAVPGTGGMGSRTAEPDTAPAADNGDTRRASGLGPAVLAVLGSLLGVHLADRHRPGTRTRTRTRDDGEADSLRIS